MSIVKQIFESSDRIKNGRTPQQILGHLMTEVGELAEEVLIDQGLSYKQAGVDGIVGESVDVILCAMDIIRVADPMLSEEELMGIVARKLYKWESTADLVQTKWR